MNEHIHNDGVAVIIYGQRLTLDEARAALGALRDSVALADSLARQAEEADRLARVRADVLDTARCPGYERELSGVIRVLNKINKPKEAA